MFKQNAETNKKWSVYFIPFQLLTVAEKKSHLVIFNKVPFQKPFRSCSKLLLRWFTKADTGLDTSI